MFTLKSPLRFTAPSLQVLWEPWPVPFAAPSLLKSERIGETAKYFVAEIELIKWILAEKNVLKRTG